MQTLSTNHPTRIALANELHARPFALLESPCRVSYLAMTSSAEAIAEQRAHLTELCDRFGAPHPAKDAPQLLANFGRFQVKWEQHTEFIALTIMTGPAPEGKIAFDAPAVDLLPKDWLDALPGAVLAAIHVHVELRGETFDARDLRVPSHLDPLFNRQSLIGGSVFDDDARFWGDFRIHEDGFMRFAVQCTKGFNEALLGRVVQRLIEVETYRAASMLGLSEARGIWPRLNEIDAALAEAASSIGGKEPEAEREVLDRITNLSAEIEKITAKHAFRFDAARAYSSIVWRRIEVLSAQPIAGLIDLRAFMTRRYDPAMNSIEATRSRLGTLSERATRAATLLRTRIDVALEEQNRALLASMNERSATQLRLQETVEGFSVVAISYYAVGLLSQLLAPVATQVGVSETLTKALVVVPVVLLVWAFVRSVKARAIKDATG
jgi:uncharacterized membrane-anchored protein